MTSRILIVGIVLMAGLGPGCTSYDQIVERRHQKLLRIYPLGRTTREDVAKKWAPLKPELSFQRPLSGWLAAEPRWVGEHLDTIERKSQKAVASFERYFGVDGLFSLCRCWFYFSMRRV